MPVDASHGSCASVHAWPCHSPSCWTVHHGGTLALLKKPSGQGVSPHRPAVKTVGLYGKTTQGSNQDANPRSQARSGTWTFRLQPASRASARAPASYAAVQERHMRADRMSSCRVHPDAVGNRGTAGGRGHPGTHPSSARDLRKNRRRWHGRSSPRPLRGCPTGQGGQRAKRGHVEVASDDVADFTWILAAMRRRRYLPGGGGTASFTLDDSFRG